MCGIAGIFETSLSSEDLYAALLRMERSLHHRGPDQGAVRVFDQPRGGLAVRRLSIVDLEHGNQPCCDERGTSFTLLNGEIYNHGELREWLRSRGHTFSGHSDTEAVAHLYQENGIDCFSRLHGMFAIAIYDPARQQLVLARDGPGMKPLYLARTGRGLVFGSDARTLFASGLIRPEANPPVIDTYLATGFVPAPLSAFRGVERVRAGEYLVARSDDFQRGRFWQLGFQTADPRTTDADYSEQAEAVLSAAVRSHLAADVPVGAFLSGGWDSSLIATLAARSSQRQLQTFSVTFPEDPAADESRFSRAVAAHLATDHHEIEFRGSLMPDLVPRVARALEEPCANVPAGVVYVLAALAHTHVKTVLSGEGADELFAGYAQFRVAFPYTMRKLVPRPAARLAASAVDHVRLRRGLRFLAAPDGRTADAEWARLFTPADKCAILAADLQSFGPDLEPVLVEPSVLATCHDTLQRRLAFEFSGRFGNAVLLVSDKMAMAHSLEVRMPFLDRAMVNFALRLPSRLKAHRGREKIILSGLAQRLLPPEIAHRRKKGLAYPEGFWTRPPCDQYVRELLLDGFGGLFDRTTLERVIPRWLAQCDAGPQISRLVFLQAWWNEFIGI